jgi:hypothetical protein
MIEMFCKYKDALGKPNKGVHSYRIFNIAVVDVLLTIIVAAILSFFSKKNFFLVLLLLFILGIIMHYLFCVKTTVHMFIFGK